MIIHLIARLIKMTLYENESTLSKPYEHFGEDINVKIDFSNYATKSDIKNISIVDTSSFALKSNLASLKTEANKLDTDKFIPALVDLSKLTNLKLQTFVSV